MSLANCFIERVEVTVDEFTSIWSKIFEVLQSQKRLNDDGGIEIVKNNGHDLATFSYVLSRYPSGKYTRQPDNIFKVNASQIYAGPNNVAMWKFKDGSILMVTDKRCEVYRPLRAVKDEENRFCEVFEPTNDHVSTIVKQTLA